MTPAHARRLLAALIIVLLACATLLWRYTPLADLASPDRLAHWIGLLENSPWSPLAVIGIYIAGGLTMFPLILLITTTALVFDPLIALSLSLLGALFSAGILYAIGARFARGTVVKAFGPALERVSAALDRQGMLAVAGIRSAPIAPFTVVSLAAGSLGVRFSDYMIGTALGLAPGTIIITAFGSQLRSAWEDPTPGKLAVIAIIVVGWISLALLLQRVAARRRA